MRPCNLGLVLDLGVVGHAMRKHYINRPHTVSLPLYANKRHPVNNSSGCVAQLIACRVAIVTAFFEGKVFPRARTFAKEVDAIFAIRKVEL